MHNHLRHPAAMILALSGLLADPAVAQKRYDPGASDTEIKVGNIMPYSGPASAYGVIGKTDEAFFTMINDQGGIIGRKINFLSYDDGYSPLKTVEQARKLVESDEVLLISHSLGTASNSAIMRYMNAKKVPHILRGYRCHEVWRNPKRSSLYDGLAAQLSNRGPHLRALPPR